MRPSLREYQTARLRELIQGRDVFISKHESGGEGGLRTGWLSNDSGAKNPQNRKYLYLMLGLLLPWI